MRFKDTRVIVTGSGTGIGRGIALAYAAAGANVAIHYSHSATGAEEAVAEIEASGGKAAAFQAEFNRDRTADGGSILGGNEEDLGAFRCRAAGNAASLGRLCFVCCMLFGGSGRGGFAVFLGGLGLFGAGLQQSSAGYQSDQNRTLERDTHGLFLDDVESSEWLVVDRQTSQQR